MIYSCSHYSRIFDYSCCRKRIIRFAQNEYYRKRGSASYIVREVHSVRERERERERDTEREREKDGSDVTIVALKLAMSFALLLAKNVHCQGKEPFIFLLPELI